jgi:hypothetical protein
VLPFINGDFRLVIFDYETPTALMAAH